MRWLLTILCILTVGGCVTLSQQHIQAVKIAATSSRTIMDECIGDPNDPNDDNLEMCREGFINAHEFILKVERWADGAE